MLTWWRSAAIKSRHMRIWLIRGRAQSNTLILRFRDKSQENPEPKFKSEGYYVNVWGTELKPDDNDYVEIKNWKLIDNQVFIENTNPEFQNSKKSWMNKVGSKIDIDENGNPKMKGTWFWKFHRAQTIITLKFIPPSCYFIKNISLRFIVSLYIRSRAKLIYGLLYPSTCPWFLTLKGVSIKVRKLR